MIILKKKGDRTLLLDTNKTYERFVVAYGYDEQTGEWIQGGYFHDITKAVDFLEK